MGVRQQSQGWGTEAACGQLFSHVMFVVWVLLEDAYTLRSCFTRSPTCSLGTFMKYQFIMTQH